MSAFSDAFASARKSGKKEFKFGGKSYNTKLAGAKDKDFAKTPKKAPVPTARPAKELAKAASGAPKSQNYFKGNIGGLAASPKSDRVPAKGLTARMGGDGPDPKKSADLKSKYLGSKIKEATKKPGGALSVGKPVVGTGKRVSGLGGPVGTGDPVIGKKKK